MSARTWRNVAIVLAAICVAQWCRRPRSPSKTCPEPTEIVASSRAFSDPPSHAHVAGEAEAADDEAPVPESSRFGITIPPAVAWLAPRPDESLLDYRDRLVPIAQAAIAPHRVRVQRGLADLAKTIGLDPRQRAALDAAVDEAGTAIQERVMEGILSGDLVPARFKPSTGVAFARDVLALADTANQKFLATLTTSQRAALAEHPFDVADYLLFSVRWEDMLGVTD
jgi:hypothetical protein